jgi:hypothetical protein
MLRRQILLAACSLAALTLTAGSGTLRAASEFGRSDALEWSWSIEPGAGDAYTLVAVAKIATGYIVYGSDFKGDIGPRPSRLKFDPASGGQPDGALASVAPKRRTDKTLGTEYSYFADRAEFRQRLRRPAGAKRVTGRIEGQTCYETDGTCALFRQSFDLPLP